MHRFMHNLRDGTAVELSIFRCRQTALFFWIFLTFCFAIPNLAVAQKKLALVLGNDAYQNVAPLAKAINDARSVATTMQQLGFEVSLGENLTRSDMSRALLDFDQKIQPGDTALFFFAGHGIEITGRNYLLPIDVPAAGPGQESLVEDAAFAADRIVDRLQQRGARTSILVLDACRDNPFPKKGTRALGTSRGLTRMAPPEGVFVLYSAGTQQAALDTLGTGDPNPNSIFTRSFVETVKQPGLSLIDIAKKTQVDVRNLARSVGHQQTPAYYDQIIGDVYLAGEAVQTAALPAAGAVTPTTTTTAERNLPPATDITQIAKGFASLSQTGGPVSAPTRPEQYYHNARVFEARGDAFSARRAYRALLEFDLDVIDPHLRFRRILRAQDGRADARSEYGKLRNRYKAPAVALAYALQFDGERRREKLAEFIQNNPDYGPAYFLLSQEYSEDSLGHQAIADKRNQYENLEAFLRADEEGSLTQYFLDQSVLGEWLDDARRQLELLSPVIARIAAPTMQFMRHNTGWIANIAVPEAAQSISYRIGNQGAFRQTPKNTYVDQRTGEKMPQTHFEMKPNTAPGPIFVKYTDANGQENGPFEIMFNPGLELPTGDKNTLEQTSTGWLSFRDYDGKVLLYTTHLQSYACGIKEAYYGLDGASVSTKISINNCNTDNPHAVDTDNQDLYFSVPQTTKMVAVKLVYFDGTESEVVTFER
ncbi:MAG: caspase family protein [Stappiaceae bacterium]